MRRQYRTDWKILRRQLLLAGLSITVFSTVACPISWADSEVSEAVMQKQETSSHQEELEVKKANNSLQRIYNRSHRTSKRSLGASYRLIAGTSTDVVDKVTTEKEPITEAVLNTSVLETDKFCTECDTVQKIPTTIEANSQGHVQKDEALSADLKPAVQPASRAESSDASTSESTEVRQSDNVQQMALLVSPSIPDNVDATNYEAEPIVIDNDEITEQIENVKFEELPTDEGKTRIKTGAQFPVVVVSQITSKTAKKGDPIQARLKYDLKIGNRLIAKKGSVVTGHINYCLKARSVLHSLVSPERWYRNSGCLGVSFDEVVNEKGEHLPLVAVPARQARIVKNKAEGRELGVNHNGQVTGPWAQQLRYKALRIGLNAALAPAGVFSFGAMPVALGVIGAANPSFAFMKPVGLNVRHRRIKGFAWGFLSGIPGSWLIEDTVVKGQEAVIKPGDEFLAEFKQEFTGEPATEADLLPGASAKVRGQIVDDGKPKKKKR